MIFSGYILPDYTEVYTKSCSTLNGHIAFVKRFLLNLEKFNVNEFQKLKPIILKLEKIYGNVALDDFAVTTLGWIKLIDKPYRFIFYPNLPYADLIVLRYEKLGYTPIKLECNLIKIPNANRYIYNQ